MNLNSENMRFISDDLIRQTRESLGEIFNFQVFLTFCLEKCIKYNVIFDIDKIY